jgi:hypothetical protein
MASAPSGPVSGTGIFTGLVFTAHVKNSSEQPIYDLTITWHEGSLRSGDEPGYWPVLMPGR